jgi:hypothetical protein
LRLSVPGKHCKIFQVTVLDSLPSSIAAATGYLFLIVHTLVPFQTLKVTEI